MVNISDLPPEILRKVFLHYVLLPHYEFRDTPTPGIYRSKDTFSDPLVLTRVCSLWDQVACSYPKLWSFILLHRISPQHMPLLQQWLALSREAPLCIHLQSINEGRSTTPYAELLEVLRPHYFRLRCFILEIHGIGEVYNFSAALRMHLGSNLKFPMMERLILKFPPFTGLTGMRRSRLTEPLSRMVKLIPSLRSLIIPTPYLRAHNNLTAVICDTPSKYSLILLMLENCPNLVSVEACLNASVSRPSIELEPVTHFHLSNLRLLDGDQPEGSTSKARQLLLEKLTVPRLEVLDMDSDGHNIPTIYDMIIRSNCQLRSLSKLGLAGAGEHASNLLRLPQLHDVQQLGIKGPNGDILQLLTLDSNGAMAPLLPHLRLLDLEDVMPPVGSTLSDLLLSRFDTLEAAMVTASDCIWNAPLAKNCGLILGFGFWRREREKLLMYWTVGKMVRSSVRMENTHTTTGSLVSGPVGSNICAEYRV